MEVDNNDDKLSVERVAGGSVIKREPLFSLDGEILFVIWDNVVRAYSSQTGEWIRDLEGSTSDIVSLQTDPESSKLVYACTSTGQVVSWKWRSGVVHENTQLRLGNGGGLVHSFHIVDLGDKKPYGLVLWSLHPGSHVQCSLFDLSNGIAQDVAFGIHLSSERVFVSVSNVHHYFVVAQGFRIHLAKFRGKPHTTSWTNAKKVPISCVQCHPLEEMVSTGDEIGRIFMWRELFNKKKQPQTRLYHWHATGVTTLAFTESGSNFYSGGNEPVLVRWNLSQSDEKNFLPRVSGSIVHVAVSAGNQKIALATNDNGIQILTPQFKPISVVQNFTWVAEDQSGCDKFPIGLRVNPRTSSLMLNGRVGQLQFFSTHTRSLLHNLDTAAQNRLSQETGRVLYNTSVTHSAINMDWIVTGELLDDQVNSIELRLKFWLFDAERQTYVLNTQVELPHEIGLAAVEFSSAYSVDSLLCATAGQDNVVKIWALQESTDVNKKGKYWSCIGQTNFKNLPVKSLAFSGDGSLLSVGFGNTLCVYQSETLRLKSVLSCPAGLDGTANKITIDLPEAGADTATTTPIKSKSPKKSTTPSKNQRAQLQERRGKLLQVVKSFLEADDKAIVKNITNKLSHLMVTRPLNPAGHDLSQKEQEYVHRKVMSHTELNFYQKIKLFDQLSLRSKGPANMKTPFGAYVQRHLLSATQTERTALVKASKLGERHRFNASRNFFNYTKRLGNRRPHSNGSKLFRFNDDEDDATMNGSRSGIKNGGKKIDSGSSKYRPPVQRVAQINSVAFGQGENAHLVIVCTERRLLIWNLLTLRLQTAIKLSVHRLTVDPYTSLVAAFTVHNELYVFLPNAPYPLYQRKNVPAIHGAAWIPRRYPKSQSLNLDWQATSQLYFLSTKQELLQLVNDSDQDSLASSAAYLQDGNQPMSYTPFGALIARQIHNATSVESAKSAGSGGGIALGRHGKSTVKEVIGLQTHTMAPVNLICKGFLRSLADSDHPLASRGKPQQSARASSTNGVAFDYIDYDQPMLLDDDDDDDVITSDPFTKAKLDARKQQLTSHQPNKPDRNTSADNHSLDLQLRHLMHRTFALCI